MSEPVQVSTDLYRSTIVLDATGYVSHYKFKVKNSIGMVKEEESVENTVEHNFREMFRPKEYWYLPETELSYTQSDAANIFYDAFEKRIFNHDLIDTHLKYNIFIYDKISNMDEDRIECLINFIQTLFIRLSAVHTDLHTFFVVSKYQENTKEAMENMDRLVERVLLNDNQRLTQLILLDSLPLTKVDASIRATVRAAALLSRNNQISIDLNRRAADQDNPTIWNWTMTEFDEEELERIKTRVADLHEYLNDHKEFPAGTLAANINKICHNEHDKLFAEPIMKYGMPVPSDCIKRGLFGGKSAQEACDSFSLALKRSFEINARLHCFDVYSEERAFELCKELLNNISLNHWKEVPQTLQQQHKSASGSFTVSTIGVKAGGSIVAMLNQVRDHINTYNARLEKYFPEFINWVLQKHIKNWIDAKERIEQENAENELQELKNTLADLANIGDGQQYLNRCIDLTKEKIAVRYRKVFDMIPYVLISDRISAKWNQYDPFCPNNLNTSAIYNFQDLQEFEFQTMQLTAFRKADYDISKEFIFK